MVTTYNTRERSFPTRQYPYRASGAAFADDPFRDVPPASVVRFILGRDATAKVLDNDTLATNVADPFALLLRAGHRPRTFVAILTLLDSLHGPEALPVECFYRAADGGQIPWTPETEDLDRHLRIVLTRGRGDEAELFVSTAPPFDSETIFLQVFAWDPRLEAYNFYERRTGVWSWAGSSWDALSSDARGHGPFDSHVNGAPVMKELRIPWLHWHSQSAQIRDEILHPKDPLRQDRIYNSPNLKGGEDLERVVRSGITRWTVARFKRSVDASGLNDAPSFLRHVLGTTTFNLACAPQESQSLLPDEQLRLPATFFVDIDALVEEIGLPVKLRRPTCLAARYLTAVELYGLRTEEGQFQFAGDTHFAFAVPERAFEDRMVLHELLARQALSRKLACCMLMIDFPNPVFSARRSSLMKYVDDRIALDGGVELDGSFAAAVAASVEASNPASAEAEFLANWKLADDAWESAFAQRLERYWKSVTDRCDTDEGFDAYFRLAESRRRETRRRPLLEFGLTLAKAAKIPEGDSLCMTDIGDVIVQS